MFYDERDENNYIILIKKYGLYQELKDKLDTDFINLSNEYANIEHNNRNVIKGYFRDGFDIWEYNDFLALYYARKHSNYCKK